VHSSPLLVFCSMIDKSYLANPSGICAFQILALLYQYLSEFHAKLCWNHNNFGLRRSDCDGGKKMNDNGFLKSIVNTYNFQRRLLNRHYKRQNI